MLNSRHVFIKQGSLSSNDNGKKKFNSSQIRIKDELIWEMVLRINCGLWEAMNRGCQVLIVMKRAEKYIPYTSICAEIFEQVYYFEDENEFRMIIESRCPNKEIFAIADNCGAIFNFPNILFVNISDLIWEISVENKELYLDEVSEKLEKSSLEKIKKINDILDTINENKKVVIYGAGFQTEMLLRYTNVRRLNILRVVDKNRTQAFNCNVETTEYKNLCDADVIIVTPYYAVEEIRRYLNKLSLKGRIIYVADIDDKSIFTGHENIWAPDSSCQVKENDYDDEFKQLLNITDVVNNNTNRYVQVLNFHKRNSKMVKNEEDENFEEKVGIILQGPVVKNQKFTLNTVRLYREYYPNAKIIVSIWEDEVLSDEWIDLDEKNVEVVYSYRPNIRGYQNVNLQLTTTYAGIRRAKELGCSVVFKTRTDMRFYSPEMLMLADFMMKKYPAKKNTQQKERLMIFPPRMDYFFFISDFFMAGNVDDMLNYWNIEPPFSNDYLGESAETMLGIRYANCAGRKISNSLDNLGEYIQIMKDYFIVIDDKMLEYVWYKYFYNKLWYSEYHYNILNYSDWLEGQDR